MVGKAKRGHAHRWCAGIAFLWAAVCAGPVLSAGLAEAATVTDRPMLFSFDGSDSSLGHLRSIGHIAIDNATGNIFVAEQTRDVNGNSVEPFAVCRFNPDGSAGTFPATGSSCLVGSPSLPFAAGVSVAVDNSGGPSQGELYVSSRSPASLQAFEPSGAFLWSLTPDIGPNDVAVDSSGHPWIAPDSEGPVIEYANTGTPPSQIDSFQSNGAFGIDLDSSGSVYLSGGGVEKYVGGVFSSTLDPGPFVPDVYVDQSNASGHIFALHEEDFNEYDSSGALAGTFGLGGAIDSGLGIAYDGALDRVYVGDGGTREISAFGPPVTGTVPDASIETTGGITVGSATFHGVVNPQSVPSAYYFEWSRGSEWRDVERSPLQSLPEDSSTHPVSFTTKNLRGSAGYRVRLVTLNTEKNLHAASTADEFETEAQTHLPDVTIDPVEADPAAPCTTGITAEGACVSGTVNPWEETLTWSVQLSTDAGCKEDSFVDASTQTLLAEGRTTPVPVHASLEGLLPAQHYCARIWATNSLGSASSGVEQFTTATIPPAEASAAFASARTDTAARINGRVNPQGEAPLTYRFEYSEDGATWTALPERVSPVAAREQIVVADRLTGLKPGTTYHYRFGLVENAGGPAASLGEERTFTTRSSGEVAQPPSCPNGVVRSLQHSGFLHDCRGIELVNSADKGNQNASGATPLAGTSPMSSDGNKVFWRVAGGAPGAPNGTKTVFLARRSPSGWRSASIVPAAEEQFGGGELANEFAASTPDFETFIVDAGFSKPLEVPDPPILLRSRQGGPEELLKTYEVLPENAIYQSLLDLSDDGDHVLFMDAKTLQLEDIGTPGAPEVVSLMPDDTPSACGLDVNGRGSFSPSAQPGYHWIATTDASRVYFQVPPNADCSAPFGLYVRNRESGNTTLIDPGTTFGGEELSPRLIRATPDGRQAYFLTSSKLEPADQNNDRDVYRWDEKTGTSACLTCLVPDADLPGGSKQGSVLVSNDFSHIYFESKKKLVAGAGRAGDVNVYALSGGAIRFVADVGSEEGVLVGHFELGPEISDGGSALLFETDASPRLTADEVAPQCVEPTIEHELGTCRELYLYEDAGASLDCLSCNPDQVTTHSVGAPNEGRRPNFKLSGDGTTVAFATQEGLLAADVNHNTDIYEWRNGVLGLVTDGVSAFQENFLTAPQVVAVDGDGSDILFALVPPEGNLTGFERDRLLNLYDARTGGGFVPPSPPAHCEGDFCQGPLQSSPPPRQIGSSGVQGFGNVKGGGRKHRCTKGKSHRRKQRRCPKAHRKPKHHHHHKQARSGNGGER